MNLCSIWSWKKGKEIQEEGCIDPSSNKYASILCTKLLYILKIHVLFKCTLLVFLSAPVSGSRPTLPQLLTMDLPLRVGDRFETFGVLLLDDETGDKMAIMREKFMRDPERVTMEVLREWLAGKGVEVSWESLIATLRNSKLKLMADQIQIALDQLRS